MPKKSSKIFQCNLEGQKLGYFEIRHLNLKNKITKVVESMCRESVHHILTYKFKVKNETKMLFYKIILPEFLGKKITAA